MALNNRTKLGVILAVAVLAGLMSAWIAILLLVLAALLIAWGLMPERTETFVGSPALPPGSIQYQTAGEKPASTDMAPKRRADKF